MAISVAHSTAADGTFSAAGVTAWDAVHSLAGFGTGVETALAVAVGSAGAFVTFDGALGTPSSGTLTNATGLPDGGLSLTDVVTNNVSITAHGFAPKAPNVATQYLDGTGAWSTPAGGATLNGITDATADQAGIANADWNVRWNWAKTTNSEVAFEIGESAASTGGTSTSGVPNQIITKLSTAAASTASPLSVYSRGVHVFSVSPSAATILAANGTAAAPTYAFVGGVTSGMSLSAANVVSISASGNTMVDVDNNAGLIDFWPFGGGPTGTNANVRLLGYGTNGGLQIGYHAANATAAPLNFRKSRGTNTAPTVITTGDDLATISGYGYVGATGTYVQAATIRFDSTGTIANTTSGTGGIIRFEAAAVGAVAPAEIMRLTRATTTGGGWATMNEADASPAAGDLADGDEAAIYIKAGNLVIAQNVGGAMKFLFIPIDGTTTTWTADGTGP